MKEPLEARLTPQLRMIQSPGSWTSLVLYMLRMGDNVTIVHEPRLLSDRESDQKMTPEQIADIRSRRNTDTIWLLYFEDGDHDNEMFISRKKAHERFYQCRVEWDWNCQLFVKDSLDDATDHMLKLKQAREALQGTLDLFKKDHAIDHFNWSASALRAQDIRELNEAPLKIAAALAALSNSNKSDGDKI